MTNPLAELQTVIDQAVQTAGAQFTAQLAAKDQALAAANAKIADLEAQLNHGAGGTLWGANASTPAALAAVEKALGRMQVVRYYHQPGEGVGWPREMPLQDRVLVYSSKLSPRDVAAGTADDAYRGLFAAAPPDRPTYVCLWHEPEDDIAAGRFTADDLRAAWARIAPLARQAGPQIQLTTILMGYSLLSASKRHWLDYYPGPDLCDVIAWDTYQQSPTYPAAPEKLYAAGAAAAQSVGKPWAVAETGINPSFTGVARQAALAAMARAAAGAKFVCYFDNSPWTITSDPGSVSAWKSGQTA